MEIGRRTYDTSSLFPSILPKFLPWVSAERGVVEGVESVVVGDHDVGVLVEEQGEHVVALLRDGVVQRGVALRILNGRKKQSYQCWESHVSCSTYEPGFRVK